MAGLVTLLRRIHHNGQRRLSVGHVKKDDKSPQFSDACFLCIAGFFAARRERPHTAEAASKLVAFDYAVTWGDYFSHVVSVVLVNAWSTRERSFEH